MRPLSIALLTLSLLACRKLVQDEFPPFAQQPVINAFLAADSLLRVHVSTTDAIDTSQLYGAEHATVLLYCEHQPAETLLYAGNGLYEAIAPVKANTSYQVAVSLPGLPNATAGDFVPAAPQITHVSHTSLAGRDEEGWGYSSITLDFNDPPHEKNYYQIVLRQGGSPDEFLDITDTVLLNEGLPLLVFSDTLIENGHYTLTFNYRNNQHIGLQQGSRQLDPVLLELRALSAHYYHYLQRLFLYQQGRYTSDLNGAPPVFNLYSNVENGYGIFAGYAATLSDTLYPEPIQ